MQRVVLPTFVAPCCKLQAPERKSLIFPGVGLFSHGPAIHSGVLASPLVFFDSVLDW